MRMWVWLWPCSVGQGSGVAVSCGAGRRGSSDPTLLWLWWRLAAVALIWPLAWELPYAMPAALKRQKKKKKECSARWRRMKVNINNIWKMSCDYSKPILKKKIKPQPKTTLKLWLREHRYFEIYNQHLPSGLFWIWPCWDTNLTQNPAIASEVRCEGFWQRRGAPFSRYLFKTPI